MNNFYIKLVRFAFITFLLFASFYGAFAVGSIEVDQNKKVLVAPEACSYQWYENGKPLSGENSQFLDVNHAGTYQVETTDEQGNPDEIKVSVAISATGAIIKLIMLGDSTMANWDSTFYPETGWGQVFQYYFNKSNVQVQNFAISGTTTVSFYGRTDGWKAAQKVISPGDYVFIQFGHNDQKPPANIDAYGVYQNYLTKYVSEIRAKGGLPVFVTSVNRNLWTGTKYNDQSLAEYPAAMKQLGTTLKVPVVDLNARSAVLFSNLGQTYLSNFVFNNYTAGEYPNYPTGHSDQTHFREMGAIEVSRLVVEGIKGLASTTTIMNALIPFLNPVNEVAVSANPKASATMSTRTASYPAGMNITLKTIPKISGDFVKWNNAANKSVATKTLYSFTMGSQATSYTAIYKNAILTGLDETSENDGFSVSPNPFSKDLHISVKGTFFYTVQDMQGKVLENGQATNSINIASELPSGIYLVKIESAGSIKNIKVIKN